MAAGEHLLVREVRALGDLLVDGAAQVAQLHVPGSDAHEGRAATCVRDGRRTAATHMREGHEVTT